MGDERATWTIDEAIGWLDPPVPRRWLADMITANKIRHVTTRPRPMGRPALAYDAAELMRLHSANIEWVIEFDTPKPQQVVDGQTSPGKVVP